MSDLERLCETEHVKIEAQYGGVEIPEYWKDQGAHPYRVTLRRKGRRLTVPFFMGSALTNEPSAADVLSCLCSDANAPEDFEEFCSEYGYDQDSREAERLWKACLVCGKKVRQFLGDDFERFAQAEH